MITHIKIIGRNYYSGLRPSTKDCITPVLVQLCILGWKSQGEVHVQRPMCPVAGDTTLCYLGFWSSKLNWNHKEGFFFLGYLRLEVLRK